MPSLISPQVFIRQIFFMMLFVALYIGSGLLVLRLMSGNGIVATFWPPTGFAIAALLLGGLKYIPLISLGALAINLIVGCPWWIAALFGFANLLEALLGYALLKYVRPINLKLDRANDYFRIFLYAGIIAPIASATIGATALSFSALTSDSWLQNFQFWWMGDSLGVIVITPLVLIWRRFERYDLKSSQIIEGAVGLALTFVAGQMTFGDGFREAVPYQPRPFMMIIFVIWAAVRFGRHATLFILVLIMLQVLSGSLRYFQTSDNRIDFFNVWFYIAVIAVTGMALATFIHERKKSLERLLRATENLEQLSATAGIGGWELNVATMQIWFSNEALRIVEADPGIQLTVNEAFNLVASEYRLAHTERVSQAIEHGTPWNVEFGMTTTLGRSIWVNSQGYPEYKDGQVVKLHGTVHDITNRRDSDRIIHETNERLSLIFRTLTEGVILCELIFNEKDEAIDYRVLEVNDAFYRIADFNQHIQVSGALATELFSMSSDAIKEFWKTHKDSNTAGEVEFLSSLSSRHFLVSVSPYRNGKFITSFFDITGRKNMEIALRESEERHRQLVESSADAILVHQGGIIVYGNPAALKILRATDTKDLLHRNIMEIVPLEHRAMVLKQSSENLKGSETKLLEGKFKCLDASLAEVEVSAAETIYNGKPSIMIVARDISERRRAEEQIRYLGQHDTLTQLPNRALFADRLSQVIALSATHQSTFALLFLDVDHFKKINDSLGHHYGDIFLKEIALRLKASVKNIDTVSRQGGDEFLILLNDLNQAEDAASVAQKICSALIEPILIEKTRVNTSVSIGVAVYPRDGVTPDVLIKNADIAMYHAKDSGRNQFQFYSEELNRITHENLEIEAALREAIPLKQLKVHYQPQLNLVTGKIESCEALLRWVHPERGFISPGRFIPLAEESGQIAEIGRFVLRTVAENYRGLQEAGHGDIRISVNVSAKEIQSPEFSAGLISILKSTGMPASALELEVTESMIMQDTQKAIRSIHDLSEIGVHFSIDDFGTGYSSLSYLRQLKIHNLKIDQSFVRDLMIDADDAAIVRTIIGLAKNLRLQVIAEGVETPEQREFLRANGCDAIQGFVFSEALPLTKFQLFLSSHAAGLAKASQPPKT